MHRRMMQLNTNRNPSDIMPLTLDPAMFDELNRVSDVPTPEFPSVDMSELPKVADLPGSEPPVSTVSDFLSLAINRLDSLRQQFDGHEKEIMALLNAVAVLSIEARALEEKLFAERLSAAEGRLEAVMVDGKKQLAVVASARNAVLSSQMVLDNLSSERSASRQAITEFPAIHKLPRFNTRVDRLARDKKLATLRSKARKVEQEFQQAIADANQAQAQLETETTKLRDIDIERVRLQQLLDGGKHVDPETGLGPHEAVPLIQETSAKPVYYRNGQ